MKKYLIILMILFILMGVFNMDILGRSITDIQRRMVGQTNYRINVVKGIVESENINKTYNCYISGESVIYPNIPTFSRNPKLLPGDKVTIEFINGCRETPCILAPEDIREIPDTTSTIDKLIAVIVQQFSEDDYLKFYDLDGNLISSHFLGNLTVYFETDCMAMDKENNVYYIKNPNFLTKVYNSGSEILSEAIAGYPESIAIGIDGYIYTREQNGEIHKRSLSDFSSKGYITLTPGKSYYGLVLDEDGNIFTVNDTDDEIEKWSSVGVKTAYRSITEGWSSSLCLAPNENYILRVRNGYNSEVFIINKDLGSDERNYRLYHIDSYPHATSSVGSMYLFTGENAAFNCELEVHKWGGVEWYAVVDDSANSPDNSLVAAYPF